MIITVLHSGCVSFSLSDQDADEDVAEEKQKVLLANENTIKGQGQLTIQGLTKYFADHKAVDDMYLSVPKGECFGLLGLYSIDN